MGMYDSFYFEDGVLPNNKEKAGKEFQTKSLACELDNYKVDAEGNVQKYELDDWEEPPVRVKNTDPINECAHVYSHNFDYEPCRYQEYKIIIVNSKVVFAEKLKEEGY